MRRNSCPDLGLIGCQRSNNKPSSDMGCFAMAVRVKATVAKSSRGATLFLEFVADLGAVFYLLGQVLSS